MSAKTSKDAIAILLGSLSAPLIAFVMTPFYLKQLGIEGLGLVSLFTLLATVLGIFVSGVSKTYQRDISHAQVAEPQNLLGLAKGGMLLFVGLGVVLAVAVHIFGYGQLRELAGSSFTTDVLDRSVLLISIHLAGSICVGALSATLSALRDQIVPSTVNLFTGVVTAILTWFVLSSTPRVDLFYLCQLAGMGLTLLFLAIRCRLVLISHLNGTTPATIFQAWKRRSGSSGKMSLILIGQEGLGVVISQIDRLLVTSNFPLASLGTYNLAANPSRLPGMMTGPVNIVTFPEICRLVGRQASKREVAEYLGRVTFFLFLLLSSAVIVIVPSASALLEIWLGKGNVPADAPLCFTILTVGQLLLATAGPAYNLTVAHGKVGYGLVQNLVSIVVLPLLGLLLSRIWGLPGIALLWVIYSSTSTIVCSSVAYSRHADPQVGLRWTGRTLLNLLLSGLVAFTLNLCHFTGWAMVGLSTSCALLFFFSAVVYQFGWRLTSLSRILDSESGHQAV